MKNLLAAVKIDSKDVRKEIELMKQLPGLQFQDDCKTQLKLKVPIIYARFDFDSVNKTLHKAKSQLESS